MARRRPTLEQTIDSVADVRDRPEHPDALTTLKSALMHPHGRAVAFAVRVIHEQEHLDLIDEVAAQFTRFLPAADSVDESTYKRDPGCKAKMAIVEALRAAEVFNADIFLAGFHCVQTEPGFGGSTDTAAALRAESALALVDMGLPQICRMLALLLADSEREARMGAATALGCTQTEEAAVLLRFKAKVGDEHAEVTSSVLQALLAMEGAGAIDFVAGFLRGQGPEVAEVAALALGDARLPAAFGFLKAAAERTAAAESRRAPLTALAVLRTDEAYAYLVEQIRSRPLAFATQVVSALAPFRDLEELRRAVEAAISARDKGQRADLWRRFTSA